MSDLRFAIRMLGRNRGFTAAAIGTLALGIGANAAMFAVIDGVLLRPLPYRDATRIVTLWDAGRDGRTLGLTAPEYLDFRARSRTLDKVAVYSGDAVTLTAGCLSAIATSVVCEPAKLRAMTVSEDFFSGRPHRSDDGDVILSEAKDLLLSNAVSNGATSERDPSLRSG